MLKHIRSAAARIRGATRSSHGDDELREEMQAHLDMATAENIRRGMSPEEARRRALLEAGGITQAGEAVRDQRGLPWIESIAADVKYALRALRHSRGYTAVVVLTLALGIGANTAIFSVVQGVLLKPLPHRDGDRLLYLKHSADGPTMRNLTFSIPEVRELREGVPSLAGIAEYSSWFHVLRGESDVVRIDAGLVTGNFFEVLGLSPVLGRLTRPSDDGKGVPAVIVLTHDFWLRRFGGDSSIIGKQLALDASSATVIGVLQPAPFFPDRVDAFLNMVISPHHLSAQMVEAREHRMTEVIARLAPGATLDQARTEVAAVYARMQRDHSKLYDTSVRQRVEVLPFKEAIGERAKLTLWLLMGAAAFVMIISAASVANLTLMRGVRREHELVVRAALGAGVRRLRRLLLVENLVLTGMGAAIGVLIAIGGLGLLVAFAERYSPRAGEIRLDGVVLGFTLALSVALALLLSLMASVPKEGTFASISAGMRRFAGSVRKQRLQRALVVAQVAVSVMLLAGAGLLTRTMLELSQVRTGLTVEEVLTLPVSLIDPTRVSPAADAANKELYARMRNEIAALPGVIEAGLGSTMPLRTSMMSFEVVAEGRTAVPGTARFRADFRTASPEYFSAAGIPLLSGRPIATTDQPGGGRVVVVNKMLADNLFPGEDPIGQRIAITSEILKFTPFSGDWRTIVGVVGNTQDGGLDATQRMVMFAPFAQEFAVSGGIVIRADSNVAALASTATRIVRRIAPHVPIENVMTISQIKEYSVAPRRLNAILLSSFSALAMVIAAVGIAGVLAFSVSARTTEIGIRMSLGAESGRVQRMILREGGMLLLLGLIIGVVGAFASSRFIEGLLFGVTPHDTTTFASVAVVMTLIGVGACWIPARRAARIDPAITMRA